MRYLADSMLGKLAKWLRVMGYDTHYQRSYRADTIDQLVKDGRRLLSRHKETVDHYGDAILLNSHHVEGQLAELKEFVPLSPDQSKLFSRCLICNVLLEKAALNDARENVPVYVFFQNTGKIRYCPSCKRYYWPGSHRTKMVRQLEEWGFVR
jgi:uncharacterized protein with PIN domain